MVPRQKLQELQSSSTIVYRLLRCFYHSKPVISTIIITHYYGIIIKYEIKFNVFEYIYACYIMVIIIVH